MSDAPALHTLQVSRTARVATLGTPAAAASWWGVLHGYGQLAADFIQEFAPIVTPERRVAVRRRLRAHDIPATTRTFDGGHRLDEATLRALVECVGCAPRCPGNLLYSFHIWSGPQRAIIVIANPPVA